MSHRLPVDRAIPGLEPGSSLERALAEVRASASEYRRWWVREYPAGTGSAQPGPDAATRPWSDGDEERVTRMVALDPWRMRSVADELGRAHTRLNEVGTELASIAATPIGTAAAARCALLAATSHERASEAATLAAGARTAGDRADELLDDVARRLTTAVELGPSRRRTGPWDQPLAESDPGGRGEGYFQGYSEILRAVRAELSAALELLPTVLGLHPAARADAGGWAVQPGAGTWTAEPGTGPRLPGTDARRVETDTGVRIARLPDLPRR